MRGEHHNRIYRQHHIHGIIPACAGSTVPSRPRRRWRRDHPRMRGEHGQATTGDGRWEGSSPHARGAQPRERGHGAALGIIPACAGSTHPGKVNDPLKGDHPRMRGEHKDMPGDVSAQKGSSPHARGARNSRAHRLTTWGIIPACAGSTSRGSRRLRAGKDHPRMRGEHRAPVSISRDPLGSSPHARGARST